MVRNITGAIGRSQSLMVHALETAMWQDKHKGKGKSQCYKGVNETRAVKPKRDTILESMPNPAPGYKPPRRFRLKSTFQAGDREYEN